jgi:hypothetical protein
MILRTLSAVILSFGILSSCCENSFASTPSHPKGNKAGRRQDREQRELVTTMPAPNRANLDSSLSGPPHGLKSRHQNEPINDVDITLPSPSVKVGSKEVLMSPWMPVRSSLGVQMELTW